MVFPLPHPGPRPRAWPTAWSTAGTWSLLNFDQKRADSYVVAGLSHQALVAHGEVKLIPLCDHFAGYLWDVKGSGETCFER